MMAMALDGVRVLDLTRLLPGGVCTMILADMGADIIKVEDPVGGDYARWMQPQVDGMGAFFRTSNRNKRSIVINLKTEDGQQVFHKLVESADVVLEGFRPSVTKRLKVDYDTLKMINPRIVYCSLSGWGQDGPYQNKSGHDLNYVALGGIQGSTRTPHPLGAQIADVGASYVGVMAICAALFKRERTGDGDYVDVSLFESAMPFAIVQFVESLTAGFRGGDGTLTGRLACYEVYYSQDVQPMTLAALEPKFWANFCHTVERPEWLEIHHDPQKQTQLKSAIQVMFRTKTAEEWNDLLANADCCFTLVTAPEDVIHDAQVKARQAAGISENGIPWMRSPARFRSDEFSIGDVPEYGEHTTAILSEAGYSDEDIAQLQASGAVGLKK
ncbi:MAG: CaiB/BaiF CoA-transferase family protein [Anaerolineae bacterium]|nr:CaiB/BaiF CoA-transferase family protein [Anaerolineae bacterium]